LYIDPALPDQVNIVGQPSRIAVTGSAGGPGVLRVYPKPGTLTTSPQVICLYKKMAPVITEKNCHTPGVLVFDDEWFWVYRSGVLWLAYLYGDDQRAGSIQAQSTGTKGMTFTGQRGVFEANLIKMAQREKLPLSFERLMDMREEDK